MRSNEQVHPGIPTYPPNWRVSTPYYFKLLSNDLSLTSYRLSATQRENLKFYTNPPREVSKLTSLFQPLAFPCELYFHAFYWLRQAPCPHYIQILAYQTWKLLLPQIRYDQVPQSTSSWHPNLFFPVYYSFVKHTIQTMGNRAALSTVSCDFQQIILSL